MKFNIHIISCLATAHRLPALIKTLQPIINSDFLGEMRIFCGGDIGYFDESKFSHQRWKEHINKIHTILCNNIFMHPFLKCVQFVAARGAQKGVVARTKNAAVLTNTRMHHS